MKMKALFFLPAALALAIGASPVIPSFTNPAVAGPGGMGRGMKFEQLNLTDAQKAQIQQLKESSRQQMDAIFTPAQKEQLRVAREQRQRPNLNLTEDQKAKMKAVRESSKSQMEAVLTAEQKQKLQELQQQWRQRRQQQQPQ
jgi:Spy/CpxP family protein refolding chaperone